MKVPKGFPNYTTSAKVRNTAAMIEQVLVDAGVLEVHRSYEGGEVNGLRFVIEQEGSSLPFVIPINWQGTMRAMRAHPKTPNSRANEAQAKRTAWKNVYDWIRAQMALIATGAAEPAEVFFPYLVAPDGRTLYQVARERGFAAMLPAPKED